MYRDFLAAVGCIRFMISMETTFRYHRPPPPPSRVVLLSLFLTLLAATLLLVDLGSPALWEDEAETALVARVAQTTGMPGPWDGVHLVTQQEGRDALRVPADTTARVDARAAPHPRWIWTWHPWLQHYLAAASFAVFGPSAWAARLPFALVALVSVPLFFGWRLFVWRDRPERLVLATGAGLLYVLSTTFLFYSRQCRYYPLLLLGAIVSLWCYQRLEQPSVWNGDDDDDDAERGRAAPAVGLGIGLAVVFYANPLSGLAFAAGLVLHAGLTWRLQRAGRGAGDIVRWRVGPFLAGLAVFGLLAAPWVGLTALSDVRGPTRGSAETLLLGISQLWRFQYVVLPAVLWPALGWLAWRERRARGEIVLLATISLSLLLVVPFLAPLGTARYLLPAFPLAVAAVAELLARLAVKSAALATGLGLVLVATNICQALPAVPFWLVSPGHAYADREARWRDKLAWHGRPDAPLLRFLADPGGPRGGPVTALAAAIEALPRPPRLIVSGYAWDALRFRLGVSARPAGRSDGSVRRLADTPVVPPDLQRRAREHLGLPAVDPDRVDVIIPRRGWPAPQPDPAMNPDFVEIVLDVADNAYENIPDQTARRLSSAPLPPLRLYVRRTLLDEEPDGSLAREGSVL